MMKNTIFSVVLFLLLSQLSYGQAVSPFKDGDRVAFVGNSITDGGHYHSYIWLYYMTRFPYTDITMWNAGIGGDTAELIFNRLDSDVFNRQPTVITLSFGMNDTGYAEYNGSDPEGFGNKRYEECIASYKKIEARFKGLEDVRIVQIGTSPYDETSKIKTIPFKGKNEVMKRVVSFQKESAESNGWEFLDFNEPLLAASSREQTRDSSFTISVGDRIHPDNAGQMAMAYLFLKAQGFEGSPVADVLIDSKRMKTLKSDNCLVSGLSNDKSGLSFRYLANSLPYPLDTVSHGWNGTQSQSEVDDLVPFTKEMNQEILTVKGLKGNHRLFIDDVDLGVWTAEQFDSGINLALLPFSPQRQQALEVMYLNEYRWAIERRFRDYAWLQYNYFLKKGLLGADNKKAVELLDKDRKSDFWLDMNRDNYAQLMHKDVRDALQNEMDLLIGRIHQINKPVERAIKLKKTTDR